MLTSINVLFIPESTELVSLFQLVLLNSLKDLFCSEHVVEPFYFIGRFLAIRGSCLWQEYLERMKS